MKWIKWLFIQEQEYTTRYDEAKIHRILKNPKVEKDFNINIKRNRKRNYQIAANWSVGTGQVDGRKVSSICTYFKILDSKSDLTTIKISTDTRWELIAISCLGITLSILLAIANSTPIVLLYGISATATLFFWFRLVYRAQESNVVEKIEKLLRLRRANQST